MLRARPALLCFRASAVATALFAFGCGEANTESGDDVVSQEQSVSSDQMNPEQVSIGRSWDLSAIEAPASSLLPYRKVGHAIVGMAIASNDRVYTWFDDDTVYTGTSRNMSFYNDENTPARRVTYPAGQSAATLVGIAIGADDTVYSWYRDGTVGVGTSSNLGAQGTRRFTTGSSDKLTSDIVEIAIAKSSGHVYAWYRNGTVSEGTITQLGFYRASYGYVLPAGYTADDVVGIDVSSQDRTYVWYQKLGSGPGAPDLVTRVDPLARAYLHANHVPGLTVAATRGGRLVLERGYGHNDSDTRTRMGHTMRTRIGSVSKLVTAAGYMRVTEMFPGTTINSLVYGANGILRDAAYRTALDRSAPTADEVRWFGQIQARHLLSHTSGITGSGSIAGAQEMFDVPDASQVTYAQVNQHYLATQGLASAPGTVFDYSNHGAGLVGHLIAQVSRRTFRSFMETNVFRADFRLDRIVRNDSDPAGDATPHQVIDNGTPTNPADDLAIPIRREPPVEDLGMASGGMSATAGDLARFMLAIDGDGRHPDLISANNVRLMRTPVGPGWGLGWQTHQQTTNGVVVWAFDKNGSIGGGKSYVISYGPGFRVGGVDVGGVQVAVCINTDGVSGNALESLAEAIAPQVARATIASTYDVF